MKKQIFILLSCAAPLFTFAATDLKTPEPSSTIPAKREFPLNPDVKPCDDFHAYVCSKAEASFKLRDDRSKHIFSFNDSDERILDFQKNFMKELPNNTDLDRRGKQTRDYYMACMNEKESAKAEKSEVLKRIQEMKKVKSLSELIVLSNKDAPNSFGNFLDAWDNANQDDPKKLDIVMMVGLMRLPDHKYYENAELMKEYEKLLALFYKNIYGSGVTDTEALKKAQTVIAVQKDFIKTYPVASERRKRWSEKHVSTQNEFLKKYPELKAEIYFKQFPKETLVNTPIPESLEFMNTHLAKYSLDTWKDIYLLKNLEEMMDDGYKDFFQAKFDFNKKYFGGPEKRPERQERCTKTVSHHFVKELDAMMIDKIFPNFDDHKFDGLAQKIRASIIRGLENNTWLSKEGKEGAIKKITTARLQLVRPRNDREWDFNLERAYSVRDRVANLHKFNEARWEKMLKELPEPTNQDAWGMGPLTVNAYYSESENKFVVPIGILQYPFYDKDSLEIENLAAIGSVMGHEMGHSIDDNGSKYDYEGKLKNWMPMKDSEEFDARAKRLVDFFNKAGFDGKLTLGENVADLVGLTFARDAAFPSSKAPKEELQKFYIAYARSWCGVVRPEFAKLLAKTDPHAAGWARINEQVRQQAGFSEAYDCKAGDKLYLPEKERVKIW